ncbi:MAG: hypothetical protein RL681_747 [Candidatus Parcubacteria bacterium]
MAQYFGYLSGISITLAFVPFFVSIFKGQTKPERMSWFLWSLLGGIAFFSQLAKGASDSLWLPGIQAVGDLLVFLLALKYGMGGATKRDKHALIVASISLILWYVTNEPAIALFLAILVDGAGTVLTILKSYEYPTTEPLSAWMLTMLGGFFAIFAVGELNWILLAFPIYTFLANAGITASLVFGKNKTAINR